MVKKKEVILGITGSIAIYKSCEIANLLRKTGYSVTVIMTQEATKFLAPLTLQAISGNRVFTDIFASSVTWDPLHTSLGEKADLVLIAPATANIIGKIVNGICDDLLTCTVLSTQAKILIAPAMNERMYRNKIVQHNIERLKSEGYTFIGPTRGRLICGVEGIGHLADVDTIVKEVEKILK